MHVSATSQAPKEGRHTMLLALKVWAGQKALVPVQVSATSQVPDVALQDLTPFPPETEPRPLGSGASLTLAHVRGSVVPLR